MGEFYDLFLEQQKLLADYVDKGKQKATQEGVNYAMNNPDKMMQAAQFGGKMM